MIDSPAAIFLARILSSSLGIINGPIVARFLGADGRGESAAAVSALYLFPIVLSLGVPLGVRARSALAADPRPGIRSYRQICLALFIPSIALGYVVAETVFRDFQGMDKYALGAGLFLAPLMISWMCDESVLIAHQRYGQVAMLQLTLPMVNCLSLVGGAVSGRLSVAWVIGSYAAGTFATAIMGSFFVSVTLLGKVERRGGLVRDSLKFAGSSIAEAASNRLDQVVVLGVIGAQQAGFYSVAATFGVLAVGAAHAVGVSDFRLIATAKDVSEAIAGAIRKATALGIIMAGGLALGAPVVVYVLFGHGFLPAVPAAIVLSLGVVPMVMNYVASIAMVATGRGHRLTLAQFSGLFVGIGSLVIIGPSTGALGAAWCAVFGYLANLLVLLPAMATDVRKVLVRPADFKIAVMSFVARGEQSGA